MLVMIIVCYCYRSRQPRKWSSWYHIPLAHMT